MGDPRKLIWELFDREEEVDRVLELLRKAYPEYQATAQKRLFDGKYELQFDKRQNATR